MGNTRFYVYNYSHYSVAVVSKEDSKQKQFTTKSFMHNYVKLNDNQLLSSNYIDDVVIIVGDVIKKNTSAFSRRN